jgi:hypothetical protein
MQGKLKPIHRRAQRTFAVAKFKNDKAMERHELKMLRKERQLKRRDSQMRELMYG